MGALSRNRDNENLALASLPLTARLIEATEVVENLRPIGLIPQTERQARP